MKGKLRQAKTVAEELALTQFIELRWFPANCAEALPLANALTAYQDLVGASTASDTAFKTWKLYSLAYNVDPIREKRACKNCQYALGDWMSQKTEGALRGEDMYRRFV